MDLLITVINTQNTTVAQPRAALPLTALKTQLMLKI